MEVYFLAAHKALHVRVDDQLLYINLYFARCVYTSFTVICSEKSTPSVFYVPIQVQRVVCTYSPIQHTTEVIHCILSVMNCNEFSTLLLLVYMPLMLKHPFLCSVFVPIQTGFYFISCCNTLLSVIHLL